MANTKTKTTKYSSKSKPKMSSIFLCCFGSPDHMPKTVKEPADPINPKPKKTSRFSWPRIRFKTNNMQMIKSTSKTVPLEPSFSDNKIKAPRHYSKSKSKSTLLHKPPPPAPPPPVLVSTTPYYTPTQTRHGAINNVEDTREQAGTGTPTRAKRQARRLSSSAQTQTTPTKSKTAGSSYDALVGMSVLGVTLLIMVLWGRLCAILCTSAWLYFIPRFKKSAAVNDGVGGGDRDVRLNDYVVDLDSEVYKKRVIMEGLLGRNHRGGSSNI